MRPLLLLLFYYRWCWCCCCCCYFSSHCSFFFVHGSGMLLATTASPNPSFRVSWRAGNAMVGRWNAGWTTSKTAHKGFLQKGLEEDLWWIVLHVSPTTRSVERLNRTTFLACIEGWVLSAGFLHKWWWWSSGHSTSLSEVDNLIEQPALFLLHLHQLHSRFCRSPCFWESFNVSFFFSDALVTLFPIHPSYFHLETTYKIVGPIWSCDLSGHWRDMRNN